MPDTPQRKLVSIRDAQLALGGIGKTKLYSLVREGALQKVNVGTRGFITGDSLDAYVDKLVGGAA